MGCIPHFFLCTPKSSSAKSDNQSVAADPENQDGLSADGDGVIRQYSWDEIVRLTRSFSCLIGSGGFSTVYLGHVSASGFGAIKIHSGSYHLNRIFQQELNILLNVRHDNIVKLLGYCDNQDEGALVLEYVPNGSLQDRLHGPQLIGEKEKNSKRSVPVLSWRRRMTIAYQLAQALEYLHEKCSLPIVHGDIKASNILLDENLNCKLCDFGSAKMGFSSMVTPTSRTNKKMIMMGSPGYTDPHYLRTGIPSKKNDVYSYGVILLELVTGMEAFSEEKGHLLTSLVGHFECEESKVSKMVDPRLGCDFEMKEAKAMLSLAQICVGESPTQRPTIFQILSTIQENIPSISFALLPLPEKLPNSCK